MVSIRFAGEFVGRIQKAAYGIELREWRIEIGINTVHGIRLMDENNFT
jgi:hypothetical protein